MSYTSAVVVVVVCLGAPRPAPQDQLEARMAQMGRPGAAALSGSTVMALERRAREAEEKLQKVRVHIYGYAYTYSDAH